MSVRILQVRAARSNIFAAPTPKRSRWADWPEMAASQQRTPHRHRRWLVAVCRRRVSATASRAILTTNVTDFTRMSGIASAVACAGRVPCAAIAVAAPAMCRHRLRPRLPRLSRRPCLHLRHPHLRHHPDRRRLRCRRHHRSRLCLHHRRRPRPRLPSHRLRRLHLRLRVHPRATSPWRSSLSSTSRATWLPTRTLWWKWCTSCCTRLIFQSRLPASSSSTKAQFWLTA